METTRMSNCTFWEYHDGRAGKVIGKCKCCEKEVVIGYRLPSESQERGLRGPAMTKELVFCDECAPKIVKEAAFSPESTPREARGEATKVPPMVRSVRRVSSTEWMLEMTDEKFVHVRHRYCTLSIGVSVTPAKAIMAEHVPAAEAVGELTDEQMLERLELELGSEDPSKQKEE